jgi:hypothetical protein
MEQQIEFEKYKIIFKISDFQLFYLEKIFVTRGKKNESDLANVSFELTNFTYSTTHVNANLAQIQQPLSIDLVYNCPRPSECVAVEAKIA